MSSTEDSWFIVKQFSGICNILSSQEIEDQKIENQKIENQKQEELKTATHPKASHQSGQDTESKPETMKWGPFETQNQAIAKRVGLIRAGKCHPQ